MNAPRKLVIKHHKPLHSFSVVVLSCVVITVTIWVFLDEMRLSYIALNLSEAKKSEELWQESQTMKNTIIELQERIVMLERTVQVERQTVLNFQKNMIKQQDETYKLRKELEFYQGIMTSTGESSGLKIQGMRIEKASQPRSYNFKLILTHVSKSDKVITGKLSVLLEGIQGDSSRTVDIQELDLFGSLSLSFSFSNFERIERSIMLPEGFVVHRVIVRARPEGRKKTSAIERIFDWSEAMSY